MDFLQDSIRTLRGIGPKRAELFHRLGIFTLFDLLNYYPRDYKDFSQCSACNTVHVGQEALLCLTLCSDPITNRFNRRSSVRVQAQDETGQMTLIWFNQPYIAGRLRAGDTAYFMGRVQLVQNRPMLVNPTMEPCNVPGRDTPGIVPVYGLTQGLRMRQIRESVANLLDICSGQLKETLPDFVRRNFELCDYGEAIRQIHFPSGMEDLKQAKKRIVFEECYYFFILLEQIRRQRGKAYARPLPLTQSQVDAFARGLPFSMTPYQQEALESIARDIAKPQCMNRMLQGDVGSGKTVLAMFLLYAAWQCHAQGAFMAPTEILARQHYETLRKLFEPRGCRVGLLTASMNISQRTQILSDIREGKTDIVVGTQALIQQAIEFDRLGAVVVDEQHRFGVAQRARFKEKGQNPHVLIMSATPIPRTLSLILYGDLDVSALRGLPPGRQPIQTHWVPEHKRRDMLGFLEDQMRMGRQIYVVCPMIEDDAMDTDGRSVQSVYADMRKYFKDKSVACLHGKMPRDEKERVMLSFSQGMTDMLVCTTVVEVGMDVLNATVMVIEDAHRFGMAQLHQLRGRVGRSQYASFCFLLSNAQNEDAQQRLKTLCKTQDGFLIAEQDLKLRGPGEFLGKRQHGDGIFYSAGFMADMDFLYEVQQFVKRIANDKPYADEWTRAQAFTNIKYKGQMSEIVLN